MLSLYPANRVCPSADQARERHCGGSALADPGTSGLSSSTMFLLSKSQTLMEGPVAAQSQYLLGEKVRALMVSWGFLLSRSHTLMLGPVAAHNQYLLGEKVRADGVLVVQGVEVLTVIQVPEHGLG